MGGGSGKCLCQSWFAALSCRPTRGRPDPGIATRCRAGYLGMAEPALCRRKRARQDEAQAPAKLPRSSHVTAASIAQAWSMTFSAPAAARSLPRTARKRRRASAAEETVASPGFASSPPPRGAGDARPDAQPFRQRVRMSLLEHPRGGFLVGAPTARPDGPLVEASAEAAALGRLVREGMALRARRVATGAVPPRTRCSASDAAAAGRAEAVSASGRVGGAGQRASGGAAGWGGGGVAVGGSAAVRELLRSPPRRRGRPLAASAAAPPSDARAGGALGRRLGGFSVPPLPASARGSPAGRACCLADGSSSSSSARAEAGTLLAHRSERGAGLLHSSSSSSSSSFSSTGSADGWEDLE